MQIVLLSDIFGSTKSLASIAKKLSVLGTVDIYDPYEGRVIDFEHEQAAYDFFTSIGGVNNYADKVATITASNNGVDLAIGFSVGGSALWQLTSSPDTCFTKQAICFYPNQVRHMTHLMPRCKTHVILPRIEKHFSVASLANSISAKPNVNLTFVKQAHGFMNSLSQHFDQQQQEATLSQLIKQFQL